MCYSSINNIFLAKREIIFHPCSQNESWQWQIAIPGNNLPFYWVPQLIEKKVWKNSYADDMFIPDLLLFWVSSVHLTSENFTTCMKDEFGIMGWNFTVSQSQHHQNGMKNKILPLRHNIHLHTLKKVRQYLTSFSCFTKLKIKSWFSLQQL